MACFHATVHRKDLRARSGLQWEDRREPAGAGGGGHQRPNNFGPTWERVGLRRARSPGAGGRKRKRRESAERRHGRSLLDGPELVLVIDGGVGLVNVLQGLPPGIELVLAPSSPTWPRSTAGAGRTPRSISKPTSRHGRRAAATSGRWTSPCSGPATGSATPTDPASNRMTVWRRLAAWKEAGLVKARKILAVEPATVWLTADGMAAAGLPWRPYEPTLATVAHRHAVGLVRAEGGGRGWIWELGAARRRRRPAAPSARRGRSCPPTSRAKPGGRRSRRS
jgi:hypothetical protein